MMLYSDLLIARSSEIGRSLGTNMVSYVPKGHSLHCGRVRKSYIYLSFGITEKVK